MREELWVIKGTRPVAWTVPVYAHFREDQNAVVLMYACVLLNTQKEAVDAHMREHGREEKGLWIVTRTALERTGYQVEICNPEILLTWSRDNKAPLEVGEPPSATSDREEFLNGLYLTGLFGDRKQLDLIYYQFCLHSLDWLINREKPLDLYFAKLHNCPFRANWKQTLMSRFPRLGRLLCHRNENGVEIVANESGMIDELRCPDLLAMHNRSSTPRRTIEVELTGLWHKTVFKTEKRRLKQLGPIKYAEYFMQSVARWATAALRCYVAWCNLVDKKSASNVECGDNGEFRLVPNTTSGRMLRLNRKRLAGPPVVPNRLPNVTEASQPSDLVPQNGVLPDEVPPVRPSSPDVRDRRPDLYKREHWHNRELRVLLPDAAKSGDPL